MAKPPLKTACDKTEFANILCNNENKMTFSNYNNNNDNNRGRTVAKNTCINRYTESCELRLISVQYFLKRNRLLLAYILVPP